MKLIVTAHILCLTIITFNTNAMDSTDHIVYQSKQTSGTTITYTALLRYSERPDGQVKCTISYNYRTNTYSGVYFNNGRTREECVSSAFSKEEARSYYHTLAKQEH